MINYSLGFNTRATVSSGFHYYYQLIVSCHFMTQRPKKKGFKKLTLDSGRTRTRDGGRVRCQLLTSPKTLFPVFLSFFPASFHCFSHLASFYTASILSRLKPLRLSLPLALSTPSCRLPPTTFISVCSSAGGGARPV